MSILSACYQTDDLVDVDVIYNIYGKLELSIVTYILDKLFKHNYIICNYYYIIKPAKPKIALKHLWRTRISIRVPENIRAQNARQKLSTSHKNVTARYAKSFTWFISCFFKQLMLKIDFSKCTKTSNTSEEMFPENNLSYLDKSQLWQMNRVVSLSGHTGLWEWSHRI